MPGFGFTPKRVAVNKVLTAISLSPACSLLTPTLLLSVDYMTGFRCNVTGSVSNVGLALAQVPRRCGADPERGVMEDTPGNCTYGAKQPFYWFQKERNNVCTSTDACRRQRRAYHLIFLRSDVRRHLFPAFLFRPIQLQKRFTG